MDDLRTAQLIIDDVLLRHGIDFYVENPIPNPFPACFKCRLNYSFYDDMRPFTVTIADRGETICLHLKDFGRYELISTSGCRYCLTDPASIDQIEHTVIAYLRNSDK